MKNCHPLCIKHTMQNIPFALVLQFEKNVITKKYMKRYGYPVIGTYITFYSQLLNQSDCVLTIKIKLLLPAEQSCLRKQTQRFV